MTTGKRHGSPRRVARVGVAIGPSHVTAVVLRRTARGVRPGRTWEFPVDASIGDDQAERLTGVLRQLRAALGRRRLTLSFALLAPLAHAKVLTLPPVAAAQMGPLLRRNARRYFLSGSDPVLADGRPLRRRGAGAPVLAGCAAEATVEAVMSAADAVGARVGAVTAAPVALLEATGASARLGRGRVGVVVSSTSWSEMIFLEDGEPRRLQPVAGAGTDDSDRGDLLLAALRPRGDGAGIDRVLVVGIDPPASWLRAALDDGTAGPRPVAAPLVQGMAPAAMAAFGAALVGERGPQFVTEQIGLRRRQRHRRWLASLGAAAVLVLAAAGLIHLRGLHAELEAVQAARLASAPEVDAATEARASLVALRDRLAGLAQLEADPGPGWTGFFAELAGTLPDSAYLVSFTGSSGEIRLSGVAHSAHTVVPALRASALFGDASFSAPLRADGTEGRERFELTVPVRHDGRLQGRVERPGGGDRSAGGRLDDADGVAGVEADVDGANGRETGPEGTASLEAVEPGPGEGAGR
jgi:Tfp pilus assembly protein PilN